MNTSKAVASKWKKHLMLKKIGYLQRFLPHTTKLSEKELWLFLERYPFVILKPVLGTGGQGIIKVQKKNGIYLLQTNEKKYKCRQKNELVRIIKNEITDQKYLIQQGIQLIQYQNRPIDFRLVLLKPAGEWEYIGGMGKIAAKNKIITNFCKGGSPIMIDQALRSSLNYSEEKVNQIQNQMKMLAQVVSECFSKNYQFVRELGLDVGVDQQGRIWIIEVNTRPMYNLFKFHSDRSLSGKINRYIKMIREQ